MQTRVLTKHLHPSQAFRLDFGRNPLYTLHVFLWLQKASKLMVTRWTNDKIVLSPPLCSGPPWCRGTWLSTSQFLGNNNQASRCLPSLQNLQRGKKFWTDRRLWRCTKLATDALALLPTSSKDNVSSSSLIKYLQSLMKVYKTYRKEKRQLTNRNLSPNSKIWVPKDAPAPRLTKSLIQVDGQHAFLWGMLLLFFLIFNFLWHMIEMPQQQIQLKCLVAGW